MKIRDYAKEDLPAVLAIQGDCPQAAQWLAADYVCLPHTAGAVFLVAAAAYLLVWAWSLRIERVRLSLA